MTVQLIVKLRIPYQCKQSRSQLSKDGRGQPGQMGVAAPFKCKESAYWKHKEREEFGDFDHQLFLYELSSMF